ncbi:MAG: transporter substrate-binding domain-containing protein, partial [Oscillospiraceae bacterium]
MKKFMKSASMFLALAIVFSVLLIGCGKEKKTFTIGFDASFPPYGFRDDNGDYAGFDIDLAKEVAKRNGWEIKLQSIDWDTKDAELKSGTIDCIWNGFTINGREKEYTWSDPYVDNSQVIVAKKDSGIKALADLAGKSVAVQTKSSAETVLTSKEDNKKMLDLAATFKKLDVVPEYNTAFLNLESGAVDAIAMDIGVAEYQIKKRGDKFIILEEQLAAEQY